MVDLEQTEIDALLALIKWEHQDGATLPQNAERDTELRSAERKLKRPAPATQKVDAARRSTLNAIYERSLLLRWITMLLRKGSAHLAPSTDSGGRLPYVVCIHSRESALTWRISADEAEALFSHLKLGACNRKMTTNKDKLEHLESSKP